MKADEVTRKLTKEHGERLAGRGMLAPDVERVPSGVLAFDVATGGGFPKGRVSMVYGKEGSTKTSLVLHSIAQFQRLNPGMTAVFVDAECRVETKWAQQLGVDTDSWIYCRPDYAEQTVDVVEQYLYAEDVGFIALDSLAALISMTEVKNSADKAAVGGASQAVGKLYRKTTLGLIQAWKEDRYPTLVWITQPRSKIGVVFGNPETTSGGAAPRFQSSLTVRLWGKPVNDAKVSAVLPARVQVRGSLEKWSFPVVGRQFEYEMVKVPHRGLQVGQFDDWPVAAGYLEEHGLYGKRADGKGWTLLGRDHKTKAECEEWFRTSPANRDLCRQAILDLLRETV